MSKRSLLLLAALLSFCHSSFANDDSIQQKLAQLEQSANGRIGVSAMDNSNNQRVDYRANERFPFCSTSKVIAVAAILKRSEKHPNLLQRKIFYSPAEITKSAHAPITADHVNDGMSIAELSQAAIEHSDNAAMNLLIKFLGGPKAITFYARSIGDKKFRLDRFEPELNSAIPNDVRDTTSPLAMNQTLQRITLGNVLQSAQRLQLQSWLKGNTTGDSRIRAGVPQGWIVGDKTGTGDYGTTNDIGIIWPSKCNAPIVLTIFFTQNQKDAPRRSDVIATATSMVIAELAKTSSCLTY